MRTTPYPTRRARAVPEGATVVIGAARGIGAATARRLARAGAAVVVADRGQQAAGALAASIREAGGRATAYPVDVRDPATLGRLLVHAVGTFGAVGTVINCAAVLHPAEIAESAVDAIREQIDTNLLGTMLVARTFVPYFLDRGAGHLIAVASLGGLAPMPGESVYCATKFGVRGFSHSLALELRGTGVAISCVCPDSADTRQLRTEARHATSTMAFTSAPMTADDVARAIVRTVVRPRREVLVPGPRGLLVRLLTCFPGVFALLHPVLDRIGRRGQARFLARIARSTAAPMQEATS